VDQALDLAHEAAARVEASPELELLAPVELSTVAVRRRPAGETDERRLDAINLALVAEVEKAGDALVSSTRLFGRTAIRMCAVNPTTTAAHIHHVLDVIEHTPLEALDLGAPAVAERRDPELVPGWATRPSVGARDLYWVPLFAALAPADAAALVARAQERLVEPGELLIEQWDAGREVFVIIDGAFVVQSDGRRLNTVGPGDFVGELAALDWGAGYGTLRNAEVRAETAGRVLVFTPELFAVAMRRSPQALALVERTARERVGAAE
jgi:hypothetical protein